MAKVAVIFAPGFEEIEALTVVDVLRRAQIQVDMVGWAESVRGSHAITVEMDQVWPLSLAPYDAVVLPGGMPGAATLRDQEDLVRALKKHHQEGKWVAAICAAPIALAQAGLLADKTYTCYDGFEQQITDGHYVKESVVVDDRVITSRGPASALAFAYELVDQLGGDAQALRQAMLYQDIFGQ